MKNMNQQQFDTFIEEMVEATIQQCSSDWLEDIPEDLYRTYFANLENGPKFIDLCYEYDRDKHRWYEVSTLVYSIAGWLFGVHAVSEVYSESMYVVDCDVVLDFFPVKEKQAISYEDL